MGTIVMSMSLGALAGVVLILLVTKGKPKTIDHKVIDFVGIYEGSQKIRPPESIIVETNTYMNLEKLPTREPMWSLSFRKRARRRQHGRLKIKM